jgi:hypothetical protein
MQIVIQRSYGIAQEIYSLVFLRKISLCLFHNEVKLREKMWEFKILYAAHFEN